MEAQEQEKQKREKARLYCTVIDVNSNFDCIITATDKKDLQRQLDVLAKGGKQFSIAQIVKGHHISFIEKSVIDFI